MRGTAINGERVVVVNVRSGHVNLTTGCISTSGTRGAGDGRAQTVVLADPRLAAESRDDICERSFQADDIHLLKEEEAYSLQDRETAESWFGSVYQDRVVNNIRRALRRLKPQPLG